MVFWSATKSRTPTGCSLNIVFFPRILESLPHLPRQHSAANGCTKNCQPIGVTVHSHCVDSYKGILQRSNFSWTLCTFRYFSFVTLYACCMYSKCNLQKLRQHFLHCTNYGILWCRPYKYISLQNSKLPFVSKIFRFQILRSRFSCF